MNKSECKVSRWMSKDLKTVRIEDSLAVAYELMKENRIRHIPVLDKGKLVGIISDRDVRSYLPTRRQLGEGVAAFGTALMDAKVTEVMARHPFTVSRDTSVHEAARVMCQEKIGILPVCDLGVLEGVVSAGDLLWAFVESVEINSELVSSGED